MRAPTVAESGRRLRIVIPTGIFPPDIGGPASYVPRIAQALKARGHFVEVVTLADDPAVCGADPFPVRRIRRRKARIPRMVETIRTVWSLARAADLIYSNGLFIEAVIAAALAGKPVAMKVVGDWAWERARNNGEGSATPEEFQARRQSPRWELVKRIRSATTGRADRIIAPSGYLANIISGWGIPSDKITTIYNALDSLPETARISTPEFSGRTLVTIARLVRWKGIDALIEWVSGRKDLRLIIVGDGPERSSLNALAAKTGAADRVIFAGSVARPRVLAYLKTSDLFILNSLYEGLPHVILEAFAVGLPVVATSVGGIMEVVENEFNGVLVPPGRMDLMAAAVDRILTSPQLRADLTEGGRRTLKNKFSWETLVAQTEAALAASLPGRGTPG
jgi:glycosyltransferase involved in cell wall biosynthesis